MKKLKIVSALLIVAMLTMAGCDAANGKEDETPEETYNRADIGAIRAQDDYYGYLNLEDLKNMSIEPGDSLAGAFADDVIYDRLKETTLNIVKGDEEYENGSAEQIVKRAYEEYLSFDKDEKAKKAAAEKVEALIDEIKAVKDMDGLMKVESKLYSEYSVHAFLMHGVDADLMDPNKYSVIFCQNSGILGADLEEIYKDPNKAADYENGTCIALQAAGMDYKTAENTTKELMRLVIRLAADTDFEIENADNPLNYTKSIKKKELDEKLKNYKTDDLEKIAGIDNPYDSWNVLGEKQLYALDSILTIDNLEPLKAWLISEVVSIYGWTILDDHPILKDIIPEDTRPVEEQAYDYLYSYFPYELSDILIKYCYTDEEEELLQKILADLMDSYRDLIGNCDWLSEPTRKSLIEKLNDITFITGGYVKENMIKNDPSKNEMFGETLFETLLNVSVKDQKFSIENLGNTRDRIYLGMPMQNFNACYTNDNTVVICYGIMRDPWFNVEKDYYTNLGGIGAVLGHEIGHAFDSNNITHDVNGVYDPSWIDAADIEKLEEKNEAAVSYFENHFPVYGIYYVDGRQTLGENYADLGGMEAVMNICTTKEQYKTVFENYGKLYCMLMTEEDVIQQVEDDVHSPSTVRVNAILATLDEFYETYDVKEGDGMYISPDERIGRWR